MNQISFRKMNSEQLGLLRKELQLTMSVAQLVFCQGYYQKFGKREPDAAELRLLDKLATLPPSDYESAPSELLTNDAVIAETFADMMRKRFELYGATQEKMTILEAFGLANAYLARAGKDVSEDTTKVRLNKETVAKASFPDNRVSVDMSDTVLEMETSLNVPKKGDRLLLVAPGASGSWIFKKKIQKVIEENGLAESFKLIMEIDRGGIIPLLARKTNGFGIDPRSLSDTGVFADLTLLVGHYSGGFIFVISEENAKSARKTMQSAGFFATLIGALTDDGNFDLITEDGTVKSLQTSFLYHLLPVHFGTVKIRESVSGDVSKIYNSLVTKRSSKYLSNSSNPSERVALGGCAISGAYSTLSQSLFLSSIYTVLTAAIPALLSSTEPQNARIALSLELPPLSGDSIAIGSAFSIILGIYRVQAELSLPASSLRLSFSEDCTLPKLTAYGVMPEASVPHHFIKAGNRVSCVAPSILENGLPDFENLRSIIREVASLAYSGEAASVRPFSNHAITDILTTYYNQPLRIALSDQAIASEDRLSFGILVESEKQLSFREIGTVTEQSVTYEQPVLPSFEDQLIPHDKYEITLISSEEDLSARVLANELSGMGFENNLFTDSVADEKNLCRSVLTSHLLLLCGAVHLSKSPALDFCLKTMLASGGEIWHIGADLASEVQLPIKELGTQIPSEVFEKLSFTTHNH